MLSSDELAALTAAPPAEYLIETPDGFVPVVAYSPGLAVGLFEQEHPDKQRGRTFVQVAGDVQPVPWRSA